MHKVWFTAQFAQIGECGEWLTKLPWRVIKADIKRTGEKFTVDATVVVDATVKEVQESV